MAVIHFPFNKSVMVGRPSACMKFTYSPCKNTESSWLYHLNYIPQRNLGWVAGVQSVTIHGGSLMWWRDSCFRLQNIQKLLEEAWHVPLNASSLLALRAYKTHLFYVWSWHFPLLKEETRVTNFFEVVNNLLLKNTFLSSRINNAHNTSHRKLEIVFSIN